MLFFYSYVSLSKLKQSNQIWLEMISAIWEQKNN